MASKSINGVLQHVRLLAAVQTGRALPDHELLRRFVEQKDEAAFTVLIERHGPMVLGVCQRALRHAQDAEDACQATFLVFARKAGSIRKSDSLSSWLHGIACRIAANLKRQQARRRQREKRAAAADADADAAANWQEAQAILDEELGQLPERYRAPLLLCYWEGKTRDEAAEALGVSAGKLHGLLERGRLLLRERLTRRGLTLSAALCASFLAGGATHAALAPTLVVASTKAALLVAAGAPVSSSLVSTQVIHLTKEVLRNMFVTKLKIVTASILCLGLATSLIGGSLATVGSAQDAKAKTAVQQVAPSESDEAYIRRLSKDLRGVEPTPAEVHFFVNNKDVGKRQKLIDLFIQERQAKQGDKYLRIRAAQALSQVEAIELGLKALREKTDAKDKSKSELKTKGADLLEVRRSQLEAELKALQVELEHLRVQEALNKKNQDVQRDLIEAVRQRMLIEQQQRDQEKAKPKLKNTLRADTIWVELDTSTSMRTGVNGLQNTFFRALIAAAKEKKEVTAITQDYLDALMKYVKEQPKAHDAADAVLQIELVYRALGKTVEANAWGDKLKKEYPDSPAAKHRQTSLENNYRIITDHAILELDAIEVYFSTPLRKEELPKNP